MTEDTYRDKLNSLQVEIEELRAQLAAHQSTMGQLSGAAQSTKTDTISRQAAIDAATYGNPQTAWKRIEALPSAQPDSCEFYDTESHFCAIHRPSAQPEPQWIPCSEQLPDGRLNKSYLVQDKDGRRAVGTYTNWGWMFGHYMNDPVAWMPLPEPYKERRTE